MRWSLALALALLAACAERPVEECFEVRPREDFLRCGYTFEELSDMVEGQIPWQPQACFPADECPAECPADAIMEQYVLPKLLEIDPNFEVQSSMPLCREDDPETGECCYVGLVRGIDPVDEG